MPKVVTKEEYQKRINEKYPNEKLIVIEYKNLSQPAKILCCDCGQIFIANIASSFLNHNKKNGCTKCKGLTQRRIKQKEEMLKKYDVLNTYVSDTHRHYVVKCKNCGHIRDANLNYLSNCKCGCEVGGQYRLRNKDFFIKEVNRASDDEYELVGDYKKQNSKVLLRHKKCGFIRGVWAHDAVSKGVNCPKCYPSQKQNSKMVRFIDKYLTDHNIIFDREVTLHDGSRQRFDFMIYDNDKKTAIEYNGEQHYKQTTYFSTKLEHQQQLDEHKRQYCKKHNIDLIEIPYTYKKHEVIKILNDLIGSTTIAVASNLLNKDE